MSKLITAAQNVHEKEVKAADRVQGLLVGAIDKVATKVDAVVTGVRDKAPALPESVAGPVEKVTAPVTTVIGTPGEAAAYVTATAKDWMQVQNKFQTAVIEVLAPATQGPRVVPADAQA